MYNPRHVTRVLCTGVSGDTFLALPDPISMVEHGLVPRPPFNPGGGFGNETVADHQLQGSDGAS